MSSESYPFGGGNTEVSNLDTEFAGIVQAGLDPNYVDGQAPEGLTVPFGRFTEDASELDALRAPMATATGYTGNNCEEAS